MAKAIVIKTEAEKITDFLNKRENQETSITVAKQLEGIFGLEWFTIFDCIKIFKTHSVEQLRDIIATLSLYGLVIVNNKKKVERYRLAKNQLMKMDASQKEE